MSIKVLEKKNSGKLYQETIQASIRALGENHSWTEAWAGDLKRFELARRSSESGMSMTYERGEEEKRDRMQELTVLNENEQEKDSK